MIPIKDRDQVVPPGFEPRQTEPKSVVLPLHHGTITLCIKASAKLEIILKTEERSFFNCWSFPEE